MRYGKPETGLLFFKPKTVLPYISRDTMPSLIFVRAMIGRSAWRFSTSRQHQPRSLLRRLARAANSVLVLNIKTTGENNENALSSCPCRVGNHLCFAGPYSTKRHARSTVTPSG